MSYSEFNFQLNDNEQSAEVLSAWLGELGFEGFAENESSLLAYLPTECLTDELMSELSEMQESASVFTSFSYAEMPDKNWNEEWEKSYEPVEIKGVCRVRADFHAPDSSCPLEIVIQPQMSFGTGHHSTTRLMLQTMASIELHNKTVLDMGSGTGVLAIAAEKWGACSVLAIDNEQPAFENAQVNVLKNNCSKIVVKKGSAEVFSGHTFDVILANINRNVLLAMMKDFAAALNNEGVLLLSGFYTHDEPLLLQEAAKHQLVFSNKAAENDWACLYLKR
jgi:ribosomal protein L11 methyltransferase